MSGSGERGSTYAESGVNIDREGEAIRSLVRKLEYRRVGSGRPADLPGQFTGLLDFPGDHYLSLCTDGVGSKILIAQAVSKYDTIGIDCIAMNVNDMICAGAEPIAFVDYIATEEPDPEIMAELGKGLNEGARQANISIIGGETASLPEMVNGMDIAGTCLGYVRKDRAITGEHVQAGDVLIGIPSSGIHSNGYSLVRMILEDSGISYASPLEEMMDRPEWRNRVSFGEYRQAVEEWSRENGSAVIGEILLTPTLIYVEPVMELIRRAPEGAVKGMANITGGGVRNLARVREDRRYVVSDPLPVPPVFRLIQVLGLVEEMEMYQTFNMGTGFIIVVDPSFKEEALKVLLRYGAREIGRVEEGSGITVEPLSLEYPGYV